ncbi:hypothetical protein GJAV_G00005500 [Gymnothorax javanicus]|nr:hypothetical protein GJAV_G00005500 [Gymnothorax javanicus]
MQKHVNTQRSRLIICCSTPLESIFTLTEMSRTLVIAVILALHVTASLCDLPEPEKELIPEAKAFIEDLKEKPSVQTVKKIVTDVAGELSPLVDKARMTVLGLYGEYIRSWAGPYLDQFIETVRERRGQSAAETGAVIRWQKNKPRIGTANLTQFL